jgi:hypothetical protein
LAGLQRQGHGLSIPIREWPRSGHMVYGIAHGEIIGASMDPVHERLDGRWRARVARMVLLA